MSTPGVDIVPTMREFNVSNDLLGNHAGLQERWKEDGYLFFRDVLDHEPLERMGRLPEWNEAAPAAVVQRIGVIGEHRAKKVQPRIKPICREPTDHHQTHRIDAATFDDSVDIPDRYGNQDQHADPLVMVDRRLHGFR